ncbi:citrate lyase holo-[acyl-carrier protein] synthase [Serratia sp. UGAL515B_01]|uniref:citrate lyase holo-[acyl-carrier protein] synthase n=1 Tax=Serratia sp. UGAL515B_01 TaxID=2986763 RepID=UPI002952CE6D|nr:citrate lyase holo-[acyl-carrier protein] synthase [Serratia sp. UGAL515B_01]WON78407.1 citrate lyase holo-[acyl-carrier protein] synthase [Serratia sp. UGAL515B_01]
MQHIAPELAACRAVSLPELLSSRECRQTRQQAWLARHTTTLLVLTLVVPGAVKDSQLTRQVFNLGWQALRHMYRQQGWLCLQEEVLALPTGGEGYMSLQAEARRVKELAIELEIRKPIGRLWDIDVLTPQGHILSRREIGLPERGCLLCNQPAKLCARQRSHSTEQLLDEMERMLNAALSS